MANIIVIGTGLAGLACGRGLRAAGHAVTLLDKSRGVGGRLATRRLHGTRVNHGTAAWAPAHPDLQTLTQALVAAGVLIPQGQGYDAPEGISAIAKHLAADLNICRQHRVVALQSQGSTWQVSVETPDPNSPHSASKISVLATAALVIALPAPQILDLLQSLACPPSELALLQTVTYDPCLTLMAGYPFYRTLRVTGSAQPAIIDSVQLDRSSPDQTVVVAHSLPEFAARTFASSRDQLAPYARDLLADLRLRLPDLDVPLWWQIHRWRYAQVRTACPHSAVTLSGGPPLVCCGDWCQPNNYTNIDAAYQSGQQAVRPLLQALELA